MNQTFYRLTDANSIQVTPQITDAIDIHLFLASNRCSWESPLFSSHRMNWCIHIYYYTLSLIIIINTFCILHTHTHTHTHINIHICKHVCMSVCIYVCICMYVCMYVCLNRLYIYMCVCIYTLAKIKIEALNNSRSLEILMK